MMVYIYMSLWYDGAGVIGRKDSAVFLENDRKKISTIFFKKTVFFLPAPSYFRPFDLPI